MRKSSAEIIGSCSLGRRHSTVDVDRSRVVFLTALVSISLIGLVVLGGSRDKAEGNLDLILDLLGQAGIVLEELTDVLLP